MKIKWISEICATPEETERNISHCKTLGLKAISTSERPPLAIVGGGPSVADYVDELKYWPGDVWISGSAFPWCLFHEIDGWFFTIDQSELLATDGRGATKAILASCVHPSVFSELRDADIQVFDLVHSGPDANHHATTITAAPMIGLQMGYRDFTFYGCDSSYTTQTHAYYDEPVTDLLKVQCGGKQFLTRPSFIMQAEFMAEVIRMAPAVFKVKGEGLLSALIEAADYDITHGLPDLAAKINKQESAVQP